MPPLTQEDFDSATSVVPDVVKMTDGNLDPIPAEGGEGAGQEQVRTNKRKLILFYFHKIKLNDIHGSKPVLKKDIQETKTN